MPLKVSQHETIVPGADEPISITLFLDVNKQVERAIVTYHHPDERPKMMILDGDFFFTLLGTVAYLVYEEALT